MTTPKGNFPQYMSSSNTNLNHIQHNKNNLPKSAKNLSMVIDPAQNDTLKESPF